MPTTFRFNPEDEDDIEQIIDENAQDFNEGGWTELNRYKSDGLIFVEVEWNSESSPLGYYQHYDEADGVDMELLKEAIENYPFRVEETGSGNWRISRDQQYLE